VKHHYFVETLIVMIHNLNMDKATIKAKPPQPAIARKLENPLQKMGRELDTYLKAVRVSENLTLLIKESNKINKLAA